jgi:hypothetical protein
MNRHEFTSLLSQTQSMMAPARHPPVPDPQLSPRQKFQSHVRTLRQSAPSSPTKTSTVSRPSPQLQHVSSLRVQRSESPSPTRSTRPALTWKLDEEPQFLTEEREVWARPSPLSSVKSLTADAFYLQPEEESPIPHSRKQHRELRPFAPISQPADLEDRPKTSRGPKSGLATFNSENGSVRLSQEQDFLTRPSKFAEGSMNDRSAGVSSTWQEHSSIASISDIDASDDDTTPRASPLCSSVDLSEFNPQPIAAPTLAQRLFKFGTKAKSKEPPKPDSSKVEPEPHTVKKRKGLRKSMSTWTLHSDKKKAASSVDLNNFSPQKTPAAIAQARECDLLNARKRRAEEAYAQQFGMKRRKSNVGLAVGDQPSNQTSAATQVESCAKPALSTRRRRLSWSSSTTATTDVDMFDGLSDVDHQKRPSRRELEKENQQLRAMLRQQQEVVLPRSKTPQPTSASSRAASTTPAATLSTNKTRPRQSSAQKQSRENLRQEQPSVPPVPPPSPPERSALRPLSNSRNVTRQISSYEDLKTIPESATDRGRSPHEQLTKATAKHSRRASLVRGVVPRSVSIILEQDEESDAEKKLAKENHHPLKNIPKLSPTPLGTKSFAVQEDGKANGGGESVARVRNVERENWEWPDDVF